MTYLQKKGEKMKNTIKFKMFLSGKKYDITAIENGFSKENFEKEWQECDKFDPEAISTQRDGKKVFYKSLTESFADMKKELGYSHSECIETLLFMLERDLDRKEYLVSYQGDGKKGEFSHSAFWSKDDGETLEDIIKEELSEIL